MNMWENVYLMMKQLKGKKILNLHREYKGFMFFFKFKEKKLW